MSENIERIRAAYAAIVAAKAELDAAGITIRVEELHLFGNDANAIDVCSKLVEARLKNAEQRALPIAVGDRVVVLLGKYGGVDKREWRALKVCEKIVILTLGGIEFRFLVSNGHRIGSYEIIHPDDLARLLRDLRDAPKSKRVKKANPEKEPNQS